MDPLTAIQAIPGIGPYMPYILAAIAICAWLATILPAPGADASPVWVTIYRAINAVGANVGRAKNADDAKAAAPAQGGKS